MTGCHGGSAQGPNASNTIARDPAALFASIHDDFLHGNLDVAEARAAKARIELSNGGSGADWHLRFVLLDAEIRLRQNQPREALALLEADSSFPASGELAIKRDWLLGRADFTLGHPEESGRWLREARRLAEESHSPLIGEVERTEGLNLRDSGDAEGAARKFRSSLAVAREQHDSLLEASNLVDIGFLQLGEGRFDQALGLSKRAADFARTVQARRQIQLALGNVGWAYYNLGDFESALENFQQAQQQAREIGMSRYRVIWLEDEGLAQYKLGNLREARATEEQALRLAQSQSDPSLADHIVNIQTNLALLLADQGEYEGAQTYSDSALTGAAASKDRNVLAYAEFLQGLIAARSTRSDAAIGMLTTALGQANDPDLQSDIEMTVADRYAETQQPKLAETWYRRSIRTFEEKRSAVQQTALRLAAFGYGDAIYRSYARFLIEANRPTEALQLLDRSRARTLREGLESPDPDDRAIEDPQGLARRLHAIILFYSLGRPHSYLWAVDPQRTRVFTLPADAQIREWIERYQKAIQRSEDPLKTANSAAISLYGALIAPAASMIPADARVVLVPDGALHTLSFETLLRPTPQGPRYWIEDVTVTTSSSIRLLSHSAQAVAKPAPKDLLLIGDPLGSGSAFATLTNAPAEIQSVQQHFAPESRTVLTQAQAVPAAYGDSGPEQFRYIHFVAHGTASRSSPLDSAVVLSPTEHDPENFKLYARDIVQHPLHAELVTVSACYGSGLRAYAGEGLVGLAWSFLRAGSRNVIGALWKADDASTALLMDHLYSELHEGKAPEVALRDAKLALLHSAGVYRKPFYWGVFQLYAG